MRARLGGLIASMSGRERAILGGAMAASFLCVVAYVLATHPNGLAGDQLEYHNEGIFFTQGRPWWSTTPFGVAHASAWKAPLYPLWVGLWYEVLGAHPTALGLVQALLAPIAVALTWLLARRLFDARIALIGACVVAVFPLAWEFYGLLYSEALAIPLTIAVLLLFLGRGAPGNGGAALAGGAVGVLLLVRPSSGFLLAGMAAAWIIAAGWRRGLLTTAIAVAAAALVVAPWTIRNALTESVGPIPISVQDGAAYGTFNDDSANDPVNPYAWRAVISDMPAVFDGPPVPDSEVRSELQDAARDYIVDHPASLPKAFFWNGLSRLWDVRRPGRALDEVPFEGRSEAVTAVGLAMYYVLLVAAVAGLWRHRSRREIWVPVVVMALVASVMFISASGTRYRAPLEPLIVVLAASVLAPVRRRAVAKPAAPPVASSETREPVAA